MKKVLIVNRHKCSNIGDQAINRAFVEFLNNNFEVDISQADYTEKSDRIGQLRRVNNFKNIFKSLLKIILPLNLVWLIRNVKRVKKCINQQKLDLVIVGGGSYFYLDGLAWLLHYGFFLPKKNKFL